MSRSVCAVIGAGEGLGQALAKKFANQGYDIALISRSIEGSALAFEAVSSIGLMLNIFVLMPRIPLLLRMR